MATQLTELVYSFLRQLAAAGNTVFALLLLYATDVFNLVLEWVCDPDLSSHPPYEPRVDGGDLDQTVGRGDRI